MNFSYTYADSVSRLVFTGKGLLTDIVVNPSATAFEFKIYDGESTNGKLLLHVKNATVDTFVKDFAFPRIFQTGLYFEVVANITDYSLGIQYI